MKFGISQRRCLFIILGFDCRFFLGADRLDVFLDLFHIRRLSHRVDACTRARFVHDINGLIRQETASNISIGKPNGGLQRLVGKLGFVMGLVLRAQAFQNLDSSSSVGASTFTVMAKAESDYTADNFLQWLIKEQLEEVASMGLLLRVVQRAGE